MNQRIYKGLKFTSIHSAMEYEIAAIREDRNEVDVILIPSDGFAFVEKNFNLKDLKAAFERGAYKELRKASEQYSISVINRG
jgi:hypothetical protein